MRMPFCFSVTGYLRYGCRRFRIFSSSDGIGGAAMSSSPPAPSMLAICGSAVCIRAFAMAIPLSMAACLLRAMDMNGGTRGS